MKSNIKTKVLLVSPVPPPEGGIARWTEHIIDYYKIIKNISPIELIHMATKKKVGRITDKRTTLRFYTGIINSCSIFNRLRKELKATTPDVVHFVSSGSLSLFKNYFIQSIIKRYNIPNIVHFRFGRIPQLERSKNWEWKLLIKVIKRSNTSIVIDKSSFDVLINAGITNISHIPNPISPTILEIANYYENMSRENNLILFVGHIVPAKGVFELVTACSSIPSVKIDFIGPFEENVKKDLEILANQKNEASWISFYGSQNYDTIIKKMLSSSILCLPSYTEGFPNVVLEGMACSAPIIATNVGAIPEMLNISDNLNSCGICVSPKNVDELKTAIEKLLANKKLANHYGNLAKRRALCEYGMPKIWNQLENIWLGQNKNNYYV